MLSDSVIREQGTNKLSLIGVFNQWNCSAFPFRTPPFFVTSFLTNFRVSDSEEGKEINVALRIEETGSGHVLASATAKVKFPKAVQPSAMVEIPFRMDSINLTRPGEHRVVLLVDDEKIAVRPFQVIALNATTQQIT